MPFGAEARVALGDPRAAAALEDALRDGGGLAWLRGGAHEEGSARAERIVGTQLCKLVWRSVRRARGHFRLEGRGGEVIILDHFRVIIADHFSVYLNVLVDSGEGKGAWDFCCAFSYQYATYRV